LDHGHREDKATRPVGANFNEYTLHTSAKKELIMRLVKVTAPSERTAAVIDTAFGVGIESVTVHKGEEHSADGSTAVRDMINVDTSTPKAKRFLDRLLASDVYDRETFSINVRQPRSIISSTDQRTLTEPLEEPGTDLQAELWQFSHITYGLVGRVLVSAILLGHGLIEQKFLFIAAGLLFLPVLPMLMAISLGAVARQWRLALQGIAALLVAIVALFTGGALAAALDEPPLRYDEFGALSETLLFSTAIGIAAALAAIDDAGRRELIGLAAASQIGIIPTWFGAAAVVGLPAAFDNGDTARLIATVLGSILAIVIATAVVQLFTGMAKSAARVDSRRF
jgi:hypothetical protein